MADLFTPFNAALSQGFGQAAEDWTKIAMRSTATAADEHDAWLGRIESRKGWLGEA